MNGHHVSNHLSRRRFLSGAALAASAVALESWTAPLAQAAVTDVRTAQFKDTLVGRITTDPIMRTAVGFAWSASQQAPIVTAYAEGSGAIMTVINASTKAVLGQAGPFVASDDSTAAVVTLPNRHLATVTKSGVLIHTDPDSLVTVAYRGSTTDTRRSAPGGLLSTVAVSSGPTVGGQAKAYVGDNNGGLYRFVVPETGNPAANPWYYFGCVFPSTAVSIRSTEFSGGYLYIAVVGLSYTGVYRIAESVLDAALSAKTGVSFSQLQKVDLGNDGRAGSVIVPLDQMVFHQMLVVPMGGTPRLLVRLNGATWNQLELPSVGSSAPKFGPQFTWSQPLALDPIDKTRVYGRVHTATLADGFKLYNLVVFNPLAASAVSFVAYISGGQVYHGTPVLSLPSGGRTGAFAAGTQIHVAAFVAPQPTALPTNTPLTTLGKETVIPPASGAPLRSLERLPATAVSPERIIFGPRWTDTPEIGVVDISSAGVPQAQRIILQDVATIQARGSQQVESFCPQGSRVVVGTYPSGGLHSVDPAKGAVPADRKILVNTAPSSPLGGHGDPVAARPTVQVPLPDGRVAVGMIGAVNNSAGSGVTVYDPAASTVNPYSSAQVMPNQNITALEFMPPAGTRGATLICGSNARLERTTTVTELNPAADASLVAFAYSGGQLTGRRTTPLPAGVKSVWALKRTPEGRLFALVQYLLPPGGAFAPLHLLELNPVTFAPLAAGNGADGRGVYIWDGRGEVSSLGQILIQSPTQLIVRTNVVILAAGIEASRPGVQYVRRLTWDPGPYMSRVVIAANGDWYYINHTQDAVYRRVWS